MISILTEDWLLLNNSINMCEMLSGAYEIAVRAIFIKNLQNKVFNT